MRKKTYLILICMLAIQVFAEENCQLLKFNGEVRIRKPFENTFQTPSAGMSLEDKMVLNANPESNASIRTYDGSVFILSGNAQIEVDELKKRDRNDLLMLLTGLEIQQLPGKNPVNTKQTAFVLHGSVSNDMEDASQEQVDAYIEKEINGALTLYDQDYISGFVLKYSRLQMLFPDLDNPKMDELILEALEKMNMPFRKQKYIEKMKNRSLR